MWSWKERLSSNVLKRSQVIHSRSSKQLCTLLLYVCMDWLNLNNLSTNCYLPQPSPSSLIFSPLFASHSCMLSSSQMYGFWRSLQSILFSPSQSLKALSPGHIPSLCPTQPPLQPTDALPFMHTNTHTHSGICGMMQTFMCVHPPRHAHVFLMLKSLQIPGLCMLTQTSSPSSTAAWRQRKYQKSS